MRPRLAPIASPANALISVSRVAVDQRAVGERFDECGRDLGWRRDRIARRGGARADLREDDERRRQAERLHRVHADSPASLAWMKS